MRGKFTKTAAYILILSVLITFLPGCSLMSKPILIGYASNLSGWNAVLGVDGRNGASLAVEVINQNGGVAGRKLDLLVENNLGTAQGVRDADQRLIDAGVVAILGHMTSDEVAAAYDWVQEKQVVLFSPTASSSLFGGKDDFFFRMVTTNDVLARSIAATLCQRDPGLRIAAVVYDVNNITYTKTYMDTFRSEFEQCGGQIIGEVPFISGENPDYTDVVNELNRLKPDVVMLVTTSLDTAILSQQVRLEDWPVEILTTDWAYTDTLIQYGGQAVDGIQLVTQVNWENTRSDFQDFQTRYQERYHQPPTLGAVHAYETVFFLAAALEKTGGSAEGLRETLAALTNFESINGPIQMDEFGDAHRPQYLVQVENGYFKLRGLFIQ